MNWIISLVSTCSSFNSTLLKRIQLNSWIRKNNLLVSTPLNVFRLLYSTSLKLYNWIWIIKFNCWYSIVQLYSTKSKDEQVEGNSLNDSNIDRCIKSRANILIIQLRWFYFVESYYITIYPLRELNPCYRHEKAMS